MVRQVLQILLVFSLILLFAQCAQIVPLTGGERDVTPPKLVEAAPARNSTNYNAEFITLRFDEFVQVKDLSNQLIVTPRLKTVPDIIADGRTVQIKFKKEELLPNTTYRLFFGSAIADMHESNSIPEFEYVFSTGEFIDTVQVRGVVTEAFDNKPVSNILIGLYNIELVSDSMVYKTEPDYVTKTKEDGSFLLKNLPYKTFEVYAFQDKNKNNLYDGEVEKIAFLGSELKLDSDTSVQLNLFQEEASKSFVKKTASPYYGFSQIFLNKKSKVKLSALIPADRINIHETAVGKEKDTVSLYYKNINDTLDVIFENLTSQKTDTFKLKLPKNNLNKRKFNKFTINTNGNKLPLYTPLKLSFLNWMDTTATNLSKISIKSKVDSLVAERPVKGYWQDINTFVFDLLLKEGVSYDLKIDTSAFYDWNQIPNDSGMVTFSPQSKTDFGKATLKLLFNKKQNYVIQLINQQNKVEKETSVSFSLSSSSATTVEFIDVTPGIYFTKIILDDNGNNKWDSGNVLLKQQPEKVIINSKQLKIVSDWEIEEEILIKD